MTDRDIEYFRQVKERVKQEESLELERSGYHLMCSTGRIEDKLTIQVRLSPLERSVEPITEEGLEQIKQSLVAKYNVPFDVRYLPKGFEKRK